MKKALVAGHITQGTLLKKGGDHRELQEKIGGHGPVKKATRWGVASRTVVWDFSFLTKKSWKLYFALVIFLFSVYLEK